ncbi:MAG: CBS domain-containing protein [Candidatus Bathyarchaeota archaeon]|nr:CBS domain-containing protein [Candidatus Bathyarchaeum tardum]WGM89721.1 MAG: CBS domain-containing protein [Candidatus Bathyarchaeum tardum]
MIKSQIMLPAIEEVAKKRRLMGLTQQKLARLAGVSQSLIAKLESQKIDPAYTKVKSIFDTLERLQTQTEVLAEEVLHNKVIGIQKTDPVSKAVQTMAEHGYSQLPVFDGEHAVGSISEKTIIGKVSAGKDLSQVSKFSVADVMEEAFPQVGEDAPLPLISNLLRVYPAVLILAKGKVVGIVTKADLLKMLL